MSTRWVALLAVGIGCVPKGAVPKEAIEEMPPWMTKEGGLQVRLEVCKDLVDSGNTLGALDVIRQMRADGIDNPDLDLLQGKALRLEGVTEEAERLLLQAQKRLPRDARPAAELCILYADDQRLDLAVDRCKKATSLDPTDGKSWNNLGFLELAAQDADSALEAASRAVEINSTEPRYRNNLAMAQAAIGHEDQAYRTFQSTMARADAAYMVGEVVERFQGSEAAKAWYQKALQLDPKHEQATAALAPVPPPSEGGSVPPPAPQGVETNPEPAPVEAP